MKQAKGPGRQQQGTPGHTNNSTAHTHYTPTHDHEIPKIPRKWKTPHKKAKSEE